MFANAPTSTVEAARADAAVQAARGMRAALMAMAVSGVLGGVKVIAGVAGHSYALVADGVESLLDIVSSIAVWGSLKVAAADPNHRFPYGYGKAEPLAGLVIAAGLVVVAVKELLFRWLVRTGREIESRAMESDAWHHRSDALTSIAAFIGISIALWGGKGYESADDWAALAACALIAYNGVRLFRDALREILDAAPHGETLNRIRAVAAAVPGVTGIDDCRARKSGLGWLVDIHVEVDGEIPVREGHRIAHAVKDALLASEAGVLDALVHIEPSGHGPCDV